MERAAAGRSAASYRWVILAFGVLAYATSQFARQNYTGVQKFIAADFDLDKGALGVLGSAFFYSYALFQMPWGIASDRFGSRGVTALGILLSAGAMAGFATSQSEAGLLFWRAMAGVAGAAVYVAMTGGMARWFPRQERGFSQSTFGGVGGALGEGAAFFLLPVISIYVASGWRRGTLILAVGLAVMAVLCWTFLRSDPPDQQPAAVRTPFEWRLLADPQLWCYALLFSGFIVAVRNVQAWTAVYVTDVYIATRALDVNAAVVAGGVLVTICYSLFGRGIGVPLAGKMSDALAQRGWSRMVPVIGWLLLTIVLFQLLSMRVTGIWLLIVIAVLLGTAVNCFPLIAAAVSETYGPQKTASVMGFVNMVAQLSGATSLAASGYLGIALSGGGGNSLAEYQGIWLSGMAAVAVATALGIGIHVALRRDRLAHLTRARATTV
jgi:MFS transporter, OPA family, sugar phosphate sensor protein UhpC